MHSLDCELEKRIRDDGEHRRRDEEQPTNGVYCAEKYVGEVLGEAFLTSAILFKDNSEVAKSATSFFVVGFSFLLV